MIMFMVRVIIGFTLFGLNLSIGVKSQIGANGTYVSEVFATPG